MSFMQKIREGLSRFMQGRYGTDQLGMFTLITGLVLSLIASFARVPLLSFLGLGLYVLTLFRMLSRNKEARLKEKNAALSDLFAHLDRALSLGGEDHVGLGLDIDGVEVYPAGVSLEESIHDRFYEMALARYGEDLTEKLFYKNFAAFLRRHFGV